MINSTSIPTRWIGPIFIRGSELSEEIKVPLATYETTLWPSTNRGAKISCLVGGIEVTIVDEKMTRSIVFQAESASRALKISRDIQDNFQELIELVKKTSRFCRILNICSKIVGSTLYLRLEFSTGDAAGHNMVTLAAQHIQTYLLSQYPLSYVSVSANFCVDKKISAVNSILGRGKYAIAEIIISREICEKVLKTTPERIAELNIQKNFVGSIIAGSLHSANAHVANLLLATYLATGQDAANIVEGSQAITMAECRFDQLYFSVTLPNIIVGTVGHGKTHTFIQENLALLGCTTPREPGKNARRLAAIIAATVLCGELSLMAALTNEGELMRAHQAFER